MKLEILGFSADFQQGIWKFSAFPRFLKLWPEIQNIDIHVYFMMLDSYKIVYFFSALCFYELIKSVEVWKFKMRKSRSDMGWWDGRGKTFKGAQQGTYQGYCALTLCYHWMKVVLKFGLDVNINTDRIRMYAPQIQYVISHFIEKDGTTKQVAIDTHNQLLESTKKLRHLYMASMSTKRNSG